MQIKKSTLVKSLLTPLFLVALVFVPAGTLDYWQGWVYIAATLIIFSLTVFILRHQSGLIDERLNPGKGMKWWDRVYFAVSTPLGLLPIVLAALYAGRWHLQVVPTRFYWIGLLVFLLGHALFLWAKAENRFFSSVVRIQTDRGQQVCDTGPYRFVRHPGYIAGILFTIATPFVLGSYAFWAWLPAALAAVALIIRTGLEDKTLKQELPGYAQYAEKVRYRLLPKIW